MIFLENIHKEYGEGEGKVQALNGINLKINSGELVAIIGKSGSGKSTLLNIIGGIDSINSGKYTFKNEIVPLNNQKKLANFRKNNIGFILQYFALIDNLTVYENIALPLKYNNISRKLIDKKVKDVLNSLDMIEKIDSYPNELSRRTKAKSCYC